MNKIRDSGQCIYNNIRLLLNFIKYKVAAYVAIMPLRKAPWMVHLYRRQLTHDGGMARVWRVSMFPHSSGVFVPLGTLMQQPTLRKNKFVLYSPHIVVFFFLFQAKGEVQKAWSEQCAYFRRGSIPPRCQNFVKRYWGGSLVDYLVFHPFNV